MRILVLNSGSTSLKYQVFDMPEERVVAKGVVDNIGLEASFVELKIGDEKFHFDEDIKSHEAAIARVVELLLKPEYGVLKSLDEIGAVGHRVVHGGAELADSCVLDDKVIASIESCTPLAPLHNPGGLAGIYAAKKQIPNAVQVGVLDTAFHSTMPEKAYLYALPYEYYEKFGVRRYGFHGISFKYLAAEAAKILNKPNPNLILCHLGGGCSIAAVKDGKCVDTSFGMTPLGGIMGASRVGELDPMIPFYLMEKTGKSAEEMKKILTKESGLKGICGSTDMRIVRDRYGKDAAATAARDVYTYQGSKQIGAYFFGALNGQVDAIVFAGGVGERAEYIRSEMLAGKESLGVKLDETANNNGDQVISAPDSKVKVLVIPTDEELMIARDTYELAVQK